MVVSMIMSKWEELGLAIGAVVLLGMGVFGLDSIVFAKKRRQGRDPRAPKQRITYIVDDAPEEPEPGRPRR
jgi:hypothetical protein